MSEPKGSRTADLLFASLLSGAYGSGVTALFFLVADAVAGQALFTPSLIGSVVLFGIPASEVGAVRLDAVALYTLAHLVTFVAVGSIATQAYLRIAAIPRKAPALGGLIFAGLTAGVFAVDALFLPGIIARIGAPSLVSANLLAGLVMGAMIFGAVEESDHVPASATSADAERAHSSQV